MDSEVAMEIVAALGVTWMFVCGAKGYYELKKRAHLIRTNDPTIGAFDAFTLAFKQGIPGSWFDFLWSVAATLAGKWLFSGVTGMIIGLLTSIFISGVVQIALWAQKSGRKIPLIDGIVPEPALESA